VREGRGGTNAVKDQDDAGNEKDRQLSSQNDHEANDRQYDKWDGYLGQDRGQIGHRQRFPEEDAAVAAFAVECVEAIEHADDKGGEHDHHRRDVVGHFNGGSLLGRIVEEKDGATAFRQSDRGADKAEHDYAATIRGAIYTERFSQSSRRTDQ
jgi:hypothetical protein